MERLDALLDSVPHDWLQDSRTQDVAGVTSDSRNVQPGWVFVAIRGLAVDGHQFIPQAIERGAVGIVVETPLACPVPPHVSCLRVADTRHALAHMLASFYRHPSHALALIGVTGTNGKTTTTYLTEAMLRANGLDAGVIGTVTYRYRGREQPAGQTTPGPEELQRLLAEMAQAAVSHCVMEVSSHALALDRVRGCRFAAALFTNLTRDHLDFHGEMEAYYQAKARLFREYPLGMAIVNRDDPSGTRLLGELCAPAITYGFSPEADVSVEDLTLAAQGIMLRAKVRGQSVCIRSRLVGRHNVYNILGVLGLAAGLEMDLGRAGQGIESLVAVPGRLERVDAGQPFAVLVDYAHTDDALRNVLMAAGECTTGRLIVVFGAGGDRDRGKRPRMGRIAAEYADRVIITSDNPRTEPPMDIIRAVEAGCREAATPAPYHVVEDRAGAIHEALALAQPGDVVIIAGKGHEPYQIVGHRRIPFDDRRVARQALQALGYPGAATP
jgi:UDP-N-acetylmuramoyl-L-alanyl-D-glutamate--2,6-diaminopimelate ligase